MKNRLTLLCIGAHPDDCELNCGGLAALFAMQKHSVIFLSLTDGAAGHQTLKPAELARRRESEARDAASLIGARSMIMGCPDGELEPSTLNRMNLIRTIRDISPDIIVTNRPNDYHPDHRYASQLVSDSCYLLRVPNVAVDVPPLADDPVVLFWYDRFTRPIPFVPDLVVSVDAVFSMKLDMIKCHESQVFEWLPWMEHRLGEVPETDADRQTWLESFYETLHQLPISDTYRQLLSDRYGSTTGRIVQHAESFQLSEYGRQPSKAELNQLFNGL